MDNDTLFILVMGSLLFASVFLAQPTQSDV